MDKLMNTLTIELRKGVLVLCVLSQLEYEEYGYDLISRLEEKGIQVDGNTLYPLLRRLEKQGILTSLWSTDASKPRKYYKRTAFGTTVYKELKSQWEAIVANMDNMLYPDESDNVF